MVKIEYIIVAVVAVLVVAGIGYFAYDQGLLNGTPRSTTNSGTSDTTVAGDDGTVISQPVSAMAALSAIETNPKFTNWKASKTTAYLTDIASEDSTNGLATSWAFTYVSNDEQAIVVYDSGRVINMVNTPLQADVSLIPELTLSGVIDSDKADSLAMANVTENGKTTTGTASIELSTGAKDTSNWNIIYRVTDGFYRVRLDSAGGSVLETKAYAMG